MLTSRIFLVGAGGHGLVVMDALARCGVEVAQIFFFDENAGKAGSLIDGCKIEKLGEDTDLSQGAFHVCVGNNAVRQRLHQRCISAGALPHTIAHPSASISARARIGEGVLVAARAIVAPAAAVGAGVIVNHGAIIDHECVIGEFCHVAPGVTLAGNVRLGARVLVGAGANLLPGVRIGDDAVIGAGAVVTADVAAQTTVAGVPARRIR